jgi:serine/threonine-protein kinase RsbW/stage II sporulation protein AB (anti-sigma F factor)
MPAGTTESWSAPAIADNVAWLRGEAVDFAATLDVVEPPMYALKLALSEAITNAVVHAFRDREPGTVTVTIVVDAPDQKVTATVRDDGMGCLPRSDSPGLGLGLPMMSTLAATLHVRAPASGTGTEVNMTFPLGAADSLD